MKFFWRASLEALLVVSLWQQAAPVQAKASVQTSMKVSVGFQNYYDPRVWVPVRVTLSAVNLRLGGELAFTVAKRARPFEGTYTWRIRQGAQLVNGVDTLNMTIGLPGAFLKAGGDLVWERQGQVMARARLPGLAVGGSEIAGIISERPQSVQFLAGVSSNNGSTELVTAYISSDEVPTSAPLLESLRYLYVDGATASLLSGAQIESILNWVRAGGILIFGGMEPNAGQVGGFLRHSPVAPKIVLDVPPVSLETYAGSTGLATSEPLLFGEAAPGADVLVGTAQNALVASAALGRGRVVYTGFDASNPDFLAWTGYAQFWNTLLSSQRAEVMPTFPNLFGANGLWGLYAAAEQFPQINSPPLWIWEFVFGFYVFAVGPVLYLILRRRRRNELAWAYLPVMSLIVAVGIYALGVAQRPNGILTQSVGLVDLLGLRHAQIVGVEAFMSPQTRSYSVFFANGELTAPMSDPSTVTGVVDTQDASLQNVGKISFQRVNAWGGKFIIGVQLSQHIGDVSGTLYEGEGSLAGYLTNRSAFNYAKAALVVNHQVIAIGSLKKGQSVNVSALLSGSTGQGGVTSGLGSVLANAGQGVGRTLFAATGSYITEHVPTGDALFVGWTHDEPTLLGPVGVTLPATPQCLVRELVPITQIKG